MEFVLPIIVDSCAARSSEESVTGRTAGEDSVVVGGGCSISIRDAPLSTTAVGSHPLVEFIFSGLLDLAVGILVVDRGAEAETGGGGVVGKSGVVIVADAIAAAAARWLPGVLGCKAAGLLGLLG